MDAKAKFGTVLLANLHAEMQSYIQSCQGMARPQIAVNEVDFLGLDVLSRFFRDLLKDSEATARKLLHRAMVWNLAHQVAANFLLAKNSHALRYWVLHPELPFAFGVADPAPEPRVFIENTAHLKGGAREKLHTGPECDMNRVRFTEHAFQQFRDRFYGKSKPDPREMMYAAFATLAGASERGAMSEVGRVRRLIENSHQEVRYFLNGDWRFVIREETDLLVLTVEYAYLS